MSNELKPCPFCGGDDLAVDAYGIERDGEQPKERPHAVTCNGCGCMGTEVAPRSAAIEAWNSRAQHAEADGVEVVGYASAGAIELLREIPQASGMKVRGCSKDRFVVPLVRQSDHLAALSAVTAERDAMQQDLKNAFNDDLKMAALREQEGEIKQLRAGVEASRLLLEQCNEVIAEDGGVYIELRAFLAGTMPAADVIALLRNAAMTAKEGGE